MTQSTKFVANITINYDAVFMVGGEEYNNQIVEENTFAILPEKPTKEGYEFDGWSLNGVDIIDPTTNAIIQNTTYYAVFTQLHTVTFIYEDEIISTQTIRNGEYSENVSVENTDYKVFNGWKHNDSIVDISTMTILSDVNFIADITYRYDVVFKSESEVIESQIITANTYATEPTTKPTKDGYVFKGWSLDGTNVIDLKTCPITENTVFISVFKIGTVIYDFDESVNRNEGYGTSNFGVYKTGAFSHKYQAPRVYVDIEL
jgi:uncharacterized repeat protein (TIGR02543 family)